jgi:hypothetical protein
MEKEEEPYTLLCAEVDRIVDSPYPTQLKVDTGRVFVQCYVQTG